MQPRPSPSGCLSEYSEWNGNCYWISTETKPWADASADCQSRGGGWLTTITSDAENIYLYSSRQAKGGFCFIGYNDIANEGAFVWQVGGNGYTKWNDGEPNSSNGNEDCVVFNFAGLPGWIDDNCSNGGNVTFAKHVPTAHLQVQAPQSVKL